MRRRVIGAALVASCLLTSCTTPAPPEPLDQSATTMATPGTPSATPSPATDWVARENALPGAKDWQVKDADVAKDTELAGYAGQISVLPGERATLYVTAADGDFTATAYRLGWYDGAGARQIWASARIHGVVQPAAHIAADRTVTTTWSPSLTVDTTGWPEGSYLFLLRSIKSGHGRYLPLVVRSRTATNRLVLASSVTTYQAYNQWGGYSLYKGSNGQFGTRSSRVSFDRPYDRDGAMEVFKFEVPVVARAERLGLNLAYTTTWDLSTRPGQLDGARGLVSQGHDEYWTVPERDAVEKARGQGMNLAFLGANAVYWRVRLEDGPLGADRMLAGYKEAALDPVKGPTTTSMWRQLPQPRPENSLVGMLYECFPARGDFAVLDPGFFLYQGTGAKAGSSYKNLVGTEIDRAYPIAGTPKTLQVVAHTPVSCGPTSRTFSDATYYTDPSGAGVFATGTMMWVTALAGSIGTTGLDQNAITFAQKVTDTLFTEMAKGPMGTAHPARPNLRSLRASTSTGFGTGGGVASSGAPTVPHPDDD